MHKRDYTFIIVSIILFAGLIITYSNHFDNSFHFDDDHAIVGNVHIRDIKNIPDFFTDATTSSILPQNQGYRPGLTSIHAICYWLSEKSDSEQGGLNTFYYHLITFIFFVLQAFLMYFFFIKILDKAINHKWNKYFALFAVAWYCFHTASAETINYIVAGADSISTCMVLLSFVIFMYFPKKRKFLLYLIPFIFGVLVKEPALMYAPLFFLYVFMFEEEGDITKIFNKVNTKKFISTLKLSLPVIAIAGILAILILKMRPDTFVGSIVSGKQYLISQPFVFVHYFKTFILPTELSADTDWRVLENIKDIRFVMGLLFIAGMLTLAFLSSKNQKFKPIAFGIFWFFLALIPTSSIIPLSEVLNDHRIFFPFVGLVLAFSYTIIYFFVIKYEKKISQNNDIKGVVIACAALIITVHAYGTYKRNIVWDNGESLWYDVTIKSPTNGRGLMNYGLTQMRKGDFDTALQYFEKGLIYNPYYSYLHINIGIIKGTLGNYAEAEQYYKNAIAYDPNYYGSYYYYGEFLRSQKRNSEAIINLEYSLKLAPSQLLTRYALFALYEEESMYERLNIIVNSTLEISPNDQTALYYANIGDGKKSKIQILEDLCKTNPSEDNFINLSLEYYYSSDYKKCIEACNKALEIDPKNAIAYNNICSAYNSMQQWKKAKEACEKSLQIDPEFDRAKANLKVTEDKLNN